MFVVYVFDPQANAWLYFETLQAKKDLMYSLIQLYEEIEKRTDTEYLIELLILNKRFVGEKLRVYYITNPEFKW